MESLAVTIIPLGDAIKCPFNYIVDIRRVCLSSGLPVHNGPSRQWTIAIYSTSYLYQKPYPSFNRAWSKLGCTLNTT